MSMETALRARFKNAGSISAIVGTRIYWTVRPQGAAYPCIVLQVVDDNRSQNMGGFNGFRPTLVQADCYSLTASESVDLREAVIAAIVPAASQSGVNFLRGFVNAVRNLSQNTGPEFVHRESVELTIWHDA